MTNSSPGVYAKDTDLSQRISVASSTIAAVVGESSKGAPNKRVLVTDTAELEQLFGPRNPKYGFALYAAFQFLQQGNQLWFTRVVKDALTAGAYLTVDDPEAVTPRLALTNFDDGSTNQPLGKDDPLANVNFLPTDAGVNSILGFFAAVDPGSWNNQISVQVRPSNPLGMPVGQGHNPSDFFVDVFVNYQSNQDLPVETFFVSREHKTDESRNQLFIEDVINNGSKYIRFKNNPHCKILEIRETVMEFLDGANDGIAVPQDDIIKAWDLYAERDEVVVNVLLNAGYTEPAVQIKMDQVARLRGDAIAILDMPSDKQQTTDAITYRRNDLNLNSSFSAMYTPDLKILDDTNNLELYVPPSGHVGAVIALTDRERALWYQPAGIRRGGLRILGLREVYNQGKRDALDPAQINMIRFISGQGYFVWGGQTLSAKESAYQNINVRRLVNFVKARIQAAALYGVFEPNDTFLQKFLTRLSNDFLKIIARDRALYDYDVVCDERNNTKDTISAGDTHLDVYLDPTISSKRIHINANVDSTGASFREL